jgi:hypothetical protein
MKNRSIVDAPASTIPAENHFSGLLPRQESDQRTFITHVLGENKLFRWLMVLVVFLQFILFKLLYPYPDFFSDSWSYIYAAAKHLNANIWPIGYSKFLWLFHSFTHSATTLTFFQYAFLELSALYFYKTIVYFYPTSKNTRIILCIFLFFNPLNLYLSNYVSTEALFAALSLIWLTEMIWVLQRPSLRHIIILSVVFLVAFTFRYNALYYPLIAAVAFLLSKQKRWFKLTGIFLGPVLIIPVILFVSNAAKEMSGTSQFPPILGGWQWANNALYIREYIEEDTTRFPTSEMAELDRVARQYYRTVPPQKRELSSYVGNFFIRQWDAPLKLYMLAHYKDPGITSWAKVAPLFDTYGKYLIKRHPVAFARYFMLMNTKNYFLPPLEKLALYNLGSDELSPIAIQWFGFGEQKATTVSKNLQGYVLLLLPILFMLLNLYGLWGLYSFTREGGFRTTALHFKYTIGLVTIFLVLNFCFSVFANIVVMRYQVFPMIVCLAFVLLLTDYLELQAKEKNQVITPVTAEATSETVQHIRHPQPIT